MQLESVGCDEMRLTNHSAGVYAKINTLAKDKILWKSQGKNEDPSTTVFRINFDESFAIKVAKNLNLKMENYVNMRTDG